MSKYPPGSLERFNEDFKDLLRDKIRRGEAIWPESRIKPRVRVYAQLGEKK